MSATLASFLADLEAKAHAAQETVAGRLNADRVIEFHQACSPEIIAAMAACVRASECIRHWHDREPDGMVVSAEHVRLLWAALRHLEAVIKERT